MVAPLRVDTATFTGLVTFALLYGIFVSLFFTGLYVLIYRRRGSINLPFLIASILQFIIITAGLIIRWMRCQEAFITHGGVPDGAILFFSQLSDWREISSTALWAALSGLGDVMFIYRLYMVWNRSWKVCIFPLILLLGSLTTGIGLLVILANPSTSAYAVTLTHWVWSFLCCNLAQNLLVTALIVVRIWKINVNGVGSTGTASLWPVMAVLVESGALYSSSVFIFLVTYVDQNNASFVLTDMVMPIMGITFMLIIVRVGLGLAKNNNTPMPSNTQHSVALRPLDTIERAGRSEVDLAYPMNDFSSDGSVDKSSKLV